jgi:hypothetical protein
MKVRPGFLIALLAVVVVSAVIVISIMRDRPNVVALTPPQAPTITNWRVIGALIDGWKTKFVEIKAEHAKERVVYDNAVNTLCREISFCNIAFFLPGDRVPANQSAKDFFDAGGWNNYPVVALWLENWASGSFEYTRWDCDRAGADGAPMSAL